MEIATQPCGDERFDTLVVAGGSGNVMAAQSPALVAFLTSHSRRARRIASVCTGAFILAACGLLDGKRATHWYHAARLQQSYPRIRVDSNRIFIRDGDIWTSAGISAGIDLALALIEDDLGATMAAGVARQLVVYHRRPGGQSQYSLLLALNPSSDRMRAALSFAREHLHLPLSVADLADAACLSERQFGRLFRAETGQTPAKVIEQLRVEAAGAHRREHRAAGGDRPFGGIQRSGAHEAGVYPGIWPVAAGDPPARPRGVTFATRRRGTPEEQRMYQDFESELNWAMRHMPRTRAAVAALPDLHGVRLACNMHGSENGAAGSRFAGQGRGDLSDHLQSHHGAERRGGRLERRGAQAYARRDMSAGEWSESFDRALAGSRLTCAKWGRI